MSRNIDRTLELIDGALGDLVSPDAMRWSSDPVTRQTEYQALMAADWPSILANWPDIAEVVTKIAQRMVRLLEDVWEALKQAFRSMAEFLGTNQGIVGVNLTPASLGLEPRLPPEWRLHGFAAFCPRHGPTKGGLCRRCQR